MRVRHACVVHQSYGGRRHDQGHVRDHAHARQPQVLLAECEAPVYLPPRTNALRRFAHCIVSGLSHAHPGFPGSIDRVVSGQLDLLAKYGWRPIEMRLEPEVAMSLSTKRLHAGNAVLRSPWVRGPLVVLLARSVLAASLRRWIGRHEVQAGLPHACRRMRPTIDPGQFPTVQGNSKERSRASCCSVYRLSLFDTAAKRQRASLRRRRPLIAVYT